MSVALPNGTVVREEHLSSFPEISARERVRQDDDQLPLPTLVKGPPIFVQQLYPVCSPEAFSKLDKITSN